MNNEQLELLSILALWGVEATEIMPLAQRENQIYQIDSRQGRFALKICREGYQSEAALLSEVTFLNYLAEEGFAAPQHIRAKKGDYLCQTKLGFAELLHWIEGENFGRAGGDIIRPPADFEKLGRTLSHFHKLAKKWDPPESFNRPDWGHEGLVGEQPFWGRFWENPLLSTSEQEKLLEFRQYAARVLPPDENRIIHADLVPDNVMVTPDGLAFIDFDDFGTGYRIFDLVTVLLKIDHHPGFEESSAAFIKGYQEISTIDLSALDLFMALRAATYIGWVAARPSLDRNGARTKRYYHHALKYIEQLG